MNNNNVQLIRRTTAIFWLGFFMAISFMEAPLKFTAPGLSMAEGLQVGKIVFDALNHCEWILLIIILITCSIKIPVKSSFYLIAAICAILIVETTWLLPVLDAGADKIIHGQPFTNHGLHWVYIILEVLKVPVLLFIGLEKNGTVLNPDHTKQKDSINL